MLEKYKEAYFGALNFVIKIVQSLMYVKQRPPGWLELSKLYLYKMYK